MSTKVVILGAGGQLGQEFVKQAEGRKQIELLSLDRAALDVTDVLSLQVILDEHKPDLLINCSGYTAVDLAEENAQQAYLINATAAAQMAHECAQRKIAFLHFSTDYVFDGEQTSPYTEGDEIKPLNVYGASKARGEEAVMRLHPEACILRVSWLYSAQGRNFFLSMLRLGEEKDELSIVDDQVSTPTFAGFLVEDVLHLITQQSHLPKGIIHYSPKGECSWKDFAVLIFEKYGLDCKVKATTTEAFGAPAHRPKYSKLNSSKWEAETGLEIRDWKLGLDHCIEEYDKLKKNGDDN